MDVNFQNKRFFWIRLSCHPLHDIPRTPNFYRVTLIQGNHKNIKFTFKPVSRENRNRLGWNVPGYYFNILSETFLDITCWQTCFLVNNIHLLHFAKETYLLIWNPFKVHCLMHKSLTLQSINLTNWSCDFKGALSELFQHMTSLQSLFCILNLFFNLGLSKLS